MISRGEFSRAEVDGGGEGCGDCGGVLGERRGRHVAVGADDHETNGMGVEPLLEPARGIADHGDVRGGFPRVGGGSVPVQLG